MISILRLPRDEIEDDAGLAVFLAIDSRLD
jgi:hypothetical protein